MRASQLGLAALIATTLAGEIACAGPLTCADVTKDHDAQLEAEQSAFAAALAAKKLKPVALEQTILGGKAFRGGDDDDDIEPGAKKLRPDVKSWTTFKHQGRAAIASDTFLAAYPDRESNEFAADAQGNIWRVQRGGTMKPARTVTVKACQWGCWGSPGGGMNPGNAQARIVYFLPSGKSFKGDLVVTYTYPGIQVTYDAGGENCAPPP